MSYTLKWHPQAFKILKKLPKPIIKRVLDKFDEIGNDPFRYLEHYEGSELYKIRIGGYRALAEVIIKDKLILIKVFDKRGRVYKR